MQFSILSLSTAALLLTTSTLTQATKYRSDNRCGKDFGGALCNPSPDSVGGCCSQYGWCGRTPAYCAPANGCQNGCSAGSATLKTSVTTLMTMTRTSTVSPSATTTTTAKATSTSTKTSTATPSATGKPAVKEFTVATIGTTSVPSGGVPGGGSRNASCSVTFTVADNSTLPAVSTSCSLQWNPETTTPTALTACNDAAFKFNFPVLSGCADFSIHVEHSVGGASTGNVVVNKGTTPEWSLERYQADSHETCSGTAVCYTSYNGGANPLVAAFV